MTKKAQREAEQAHALAKLRSYCPSGTKLYGATVYRGRSGMTRRVRLWCIAQHESAEAPELVDLTGWLATALGYSIAPTYPEGILFNGCGYSAIDAAASDLNHALGYTGPDTLRVERIF